MGKLRSIRWLLPMFGIIAFVTSSATQHQKNSSLIVSGKSVGPFVLGASRQAIESVFPLKKDSDKEDANTYSECGTFTEINWVNFSGDRPDWGNVLIYLP